MSHCSRGFTESLLSSNIETGRPGRGLTAFTGDKERYFVTWHFWMKCSWWKAVSVWKKGIKFIRCLTGFFRKKSLLHSLHFFHTIPRSCVGTLWTSGVQISFKDVTWSIVKLESGTSNGAWTVSLRNLDEEAGMVVPEVAGMFLNLPQFPAKII